MNFLTVLLLLFYFAINSFAGGFLKQSTATTINLGPFVNSSDVVQTSLTVTNMTVNLVKQSDTFSSSSTSFSPTASGGSNDCQHVAQGVYNFELTATNTDTVGRLNIVVVISGAKPISDSFVVVGPNSWDSLVTGNVATVSDIFAAQTSGLTTAGSVGKLFVDNIDMKASTASGILKTGTAQAGTTSSITLDAGASAVDSFYNLKAISIVSGTGSGQSAIITSYVGSTKVATILGSWLTTPGASSVFVIKDASTALLADNIITAAKIASAAFTSTKFSTDAIDSTALATSAANEVRDAVLDATVEGSYSLRQLQRVLAAVLAGKTNISGGTVTFRDVNDTKTRVTATTTTSGRTAVIIDAN